MTPLLLSMLGASWTAITPDVTPVGIVAVIDVALHELIVNGESFNKTTLLPCKAPKPEPEITTCVPTAPVVEDSIVITGAVSVAELTDTLSKDPLWRVDGLPLLNAKPT